MTNTNGGNRRDSKTHNATVRNFMLATSIALLLPLHAVTASDSSHCQTTEEKSQQPDASGKLLDGLYLVERKDTDRSKVEPVAKGEQLLINDFRFLEPADRQETEYVVIQRNAFVPLIMKEEPEKGIDTKGRPKLLISLAEDQSGKLEEFSRKNTGGSVAVVIGEQVVSCHKIREPIVGGRMQITRCTDNGCAAIYSELQKRRKN